MAAPSESYQPRSVYASSISGFSHICELPSDDSDRPAANQAVLAQRAALTHSARGKQSLSSPQLHMLFACCNPPFQSETLAPFTANTGFPLPSNLSA